MMGRTFRAVVACALAASPALGSYPYLKNYRPETNVEADARIDLDMEEILAELTANDLAGAMAKYQGGTNGVQTLASLSKPGATSMASDTWWPVYKAYWSSNNDYADTFVEDAYAGSLPDGMKKELIKKGIAYQGVWMYAAHSFDVGQNQCSTNDWDKGMAHYIGSMEGQTSVPADVASTGNLLYNLAQKRCGDFGTCATLADSSTLANVNDRILNEHSILGRDLTIQQKCTDARLATSFNSIISQMTVPLVQGLLKYAWKADPVNGNSCNGEAGNNAATVAADCAKSWAEGWAFSAAVLPQIAQCDAGAATTIRDNLDVANAEPMKDGVAAVKTAVESVYACLGITCADVGEFQSSTGVYSGMDACADPPAPAPTPSPQTPRPTFCQFSNCADSNSAVPMSDAAARRAGEVAGAALAGAALAFIA